MITKIFDFRTTTGVVGRGGAADPHGRTERSGMNSSRPISGRSRGSQLPHPERLRRSEGGACTPARQVGLTRSKSACSAGPDASGNLIVGVLHSTPFRIRETERHMASRSLRRTRLRGRLTAARPCRETHRGLVGTPALTDCLQPVMDGQRIVANGCKGSHALLPALPPTSLALEEGDSALPLS